jgi:hypothetical protein
MFVGLIRLQDRARKVQANIAAVLIRALPTKQLMQIAFKCAERKLLVSALQGVRRPLPGVNAEQKVRLRSRDL